VAEGIVALIAGNWKMNGSAASIAEIEALTGMLLKDPARCDVLICPPAVLIAPAVRAARGGAVAIGAQDCHGEAKGAFTGDLSAGMLTEAGATAIIVGHSERRAGHGESSETVRRKAGAAISAGAIAIICIGETLPEREAGRTLDVVLGQLAASVPDGATARTVVIAYEPVWAIGTGLTPTGDEIAEVHLAIRKALAARFGAQGQGIRLLYGGSMNPGNATDILMIPHVNGGLVGGASLKAEDFIRIIRAAG